MKQAPFIGQQLSLKQTTMLAPQLQQGVRMLQLSSLELHEEIEQALQSNPFLEKLEVDAGFEMVLTPETPGEETRRSDADKAPESFIYGQPSKPLLRRQTQSGSTAGQRPESRSDFNNENLLEAGRELSLHDVLHEQAAVTPLNEKQRFIMELLIDSINDRGYLRATTADLLELAMPEFVVTRAEVEKVLVVLHGFEPVGVGARNSRECLLLQLKEFPADTPGLEIAGAVIKQCLLSLAKGEYEKIALDLGCSKADLTQAVALIKQLNPFPGSSISSTQVEGIAPDLIVKKIQGKWVVRLNPNLTPALSIHSDSDDLIKLAKGQAGYAKLKKTLQEARVLLSNVEKRFHTLLRVASLIVARQSAFLESGETALKPLTQKEISEGLDIHVSTVSRAVHDKYILTPAGTIKLGSFFSSALKHAEQGQISARAIQATIRAMIETEPPEKPLSDNAIAEQLNNKGTQVARRTVMKYREKLGIPASPVRRALKKDSSAEKQA